MDMFRPHGPLDRLEWSVNHLIQPDGELLHSHAYEFVESLIMGGGYTHEFFLLGQDGAPGELQRASFRAGDTNFMPGNMFHRIVDVRPGTWTFMCYGPPIARRREYWVPGKGIVPAKEVDKTQ